MLISELAEAGCPDTVAFIRIKTMRCLRPGDPSRPGMTHHIRYSRPHMCAMSHLEKMLTYAAPPKRW
jgi:hypothetical protein